MRLTTEEISFLALIFQPISIGISFFLGQRTIKKNREYEILKERYENFYCEYIKLMAKRLMFTTAYLEQMTFKATEEFHELIEKNIKYIDEETLAFYPVLVRLSIDLLEHEQGTIGFEKIPEYWAAVFILTSASVLRETQKILHGLGLPDITKNYHNTFLSSKQINEAQKMYIEYLKYTQSKIHINS